MSLSLEDVVEEVMSKNTKDSKRLGALADYAKEQLEQYGLPGVQGGTGGELKIQGMARLKDWDIAYNFAGKNRLLISLKSLWRNASGTVPNRLDELMGETANVQQMSPEIVSGYVLLFDNQADSIRRNDGLLWSDYFQRAVNHIAIRKAPLWNQGLLEGAWFIRIDSSKPFGERIIDPEKTAREGESFFKSLLKELKIREPAISFSKVIE